MLPLLQLLLLPLVFAGVVLAPFVGLVLSMTILPGTPMLLVSSTLSNSASVSSPASAPAVDLFAGGTL
jgi:hypothetical protein